MPSCSAKPSSRTTIVLEALDEGRNERLGRTRDGVTQSLERPGDMKRDGMNTRRFPSADAIIAIIFL